MDILNTNTKLNEVPPIIEFLNVGKSYKNLTVIDNFNLKIPKGEFLTIVGSSGCGKTTLLKMINGLVLPEAGTVLINGNPITNKDLISLRRHIGYAIQGNILFPHLTAAENIAYVPNLLKYSKEKIATIISDGLELVNLPLEKANKFPKELSGGEQQRVGIARACAASPEILLMDEPFGAVDAITRKQLQDELKGIHRKRNLTIVFITHDINEALKLGTKVLVLDHGKIQQYGTPDEIKTTPANDFVQRLVNI